MIKKQQSAGWKWQYSGVAVTRGLIATVVHAKGFENDSVRLLNATWSKTNKNNTIVISTYCKTSITIFITLTQNDEIKTLT